MHTAFEVILEKIKPGMRMRTPDNSTGKEFEILSVDMEAVQVRTAKGGKVKMSLFTFDAAVKYLTDYGCRGDQWMQVKDQDFQMILNMENDRVRASSYIISILGTAGLIDVDGSRPNKVRLTK